MKTSDTRTIPYYVVAIALSLPAVLVGVEIPSFLRLGARSLAFESDFRVFYTPAYMLRTHQQRNIYDFSFIHRNSDLKVAADNGAVPYLHPAYEAVLFIPLSFLPYRTAYLVWGGINFAVITWIYLLVRPHLEHVRALGPCWSSPGLLLGFFPVAFAILAGQDSLLLLLATVVAFRRIVKSEFHAGILLGFGMFRFQVLLPIVLLFILWRSFKFILGWLLTSAAVLSVSVVITGIGAQAQYAKLLLQMGVVSYWPLLRRMPNLRGLLLAVGVGRVSLFVLSLAIVVAAAVIGIKQNSERRFVLAISTSCLVTYFLFMHDLSLLALPILLAMDDAAFRMDWRQLGLIAAVPLLFAMFWFATDHFYLGALITSFFLIVKFIGPKTRTAISPVIIGAVH
jgi:Glycosyltransferase family 87